MSKSDIDYITKPRYIPVFVMIDRIQIPDIFPLEFCNRLQNRDYLNECLDNNYGYILDETLPPKECMTDTPKIHPAVIKSAGALKNNLSGGMVFKRLDWFVNPNSINRLLNSHRWYILDEC